jgi:hypothetical protein
VLNVRTLRGFSRKPGRTNGARPLQRTRNLRGRVPGVGPAAAVQDAAAHPAAAREAVDPAHRLRPLARGRLERLDEAVDVVDALALGLDPGRLDARQHALDLEHVSRETHASDGRAEEIGLLGRRAPQHAAIRDAQAQAPHVRAERAGAMVILAVHVGRHHAAQRDELGSRRDRRVEAAREEEPVERLHREARLRVQRARRRVEAEDAVRQQRRGHAVLGPRGQRRVAVRPAHAARERGPARHRLEVLRADLAAGDRDAAPALEPRLRCGAQRPGSAATRGRRRSARPRCRSA